MDDDSSRTNDSLALEKKLATKDSAVFQLPLSTVFALIWVLPSLKLTAKAPENGCLEYFLVSFWGVSAYFQVRLLLVSGSVC